MIKLQVLTESLVSEDYINAMSDHSLIMYTEARWRKWNRSSVLDFVEQNLKSEECVLFGIFLNDRHVGNVRLHSRDAQNYTCEIGILVFARDVWGQGVGTSSILMAMSYACSNWGVTRFMADYFEENSASNRLFEKAGFVLEGIFRNHFQNMDGSFSHSIRVAKNVENRGNKDE